MTIGDTRQKSPPSRFKICAAPFLAGLEMGSFAPLVPGVDEHERFGRNPRSPLAGNASYLSVYDIAQPTLVKVGARADEDDDIPFSPWAVVPSRADTRYPRIGRGR